MSKSIYSEEELEQLIQNLFLEKKKVKELEQKFQILNQEHQCLLLESKQRKSALVSQKSHESEEIEKLKSLIAAYKKKSTQAIHALYENEHQKIKQEAALAHQLRQLQERVQELTEENTALRGRQKFQNSEHQLSLESQLKQEQNASQSLREKNQELSKSLSIAQRHSEQLDRALKHLHERSQEAYLELNQFREDFQRSQEAVRNLTEQLQLLQNRLHESTQELHAVQSEKQEAFDEVHTLQGQFGALKAKVLEGQDALKAAAKEKLQLEVHLAEKTQLLNQLENDLAVIKQTLSKGMKEAKDIEGLYLSVVNEKALLHDKSTHLGQLLDNHDGEIKILQQQLEEAVRRAEAFKHQLEQREAEHQERHQMFVKEHQERNHDLEITLQTHHGLLHEKEQEIEDYRTQILQLTQEKLRLEDSLAEGARFQHEQDAQIKLAQQHLGKKVKETALLNEKMEEQKAQNAELQASLNQFRTKIAEMQTAFDQQLQQEKKHHEQLHETVRFAEGQVVKWEDKYLKANEQLKILEEKQNQMQALFTSLSTVMGIRQASQFSNALPFSPTDYRPQKETLHFADTQKVYQDLEERRSQKEDSLASSQPSLFETEQQPRKNIRQNLFD